jgi:Na+-transporting NADH:ubiquinone oxidoreductase subunit D
MSERNDPRAAIARGVLAENPITVQLLGICSALAVTRTVETALAMSISVIAVLIGSSAAISLIRNEVPRSVRLIVQITLIATFVIIVDQILQAFFWELSRELSVFVGLIITNCLVLGRAETFAMRNGVGASVIDALGNGMGYAEVLLVVGATRELLGTGRLLGINVFPLVERGGWFEPIGLMLTPPSAFFLIGGLVWVSRSVALRAARRERTVATSTSLVEDGA